MSEDIVQLKQAKTLFNALTRNDTNVLVMRMK